MIRIINHHNHFTITPLFYSIAITRGQGPLQIRGGRVAAEGATEGRRVPRVSAGLHGHPEGRGFCFEPGLSRGYPRIWRVREWRNTMKP